MTKRVDRRSNGVPERVLRCHTRRRVRVRHGGATLHHENPQARRLVCPVERNAVPGSSVRFYDPATGQFLTRDPAVASTRSAYGYAGNSPVNATDPSGLYCLSGVKGHDADGDEICNGAREVVENAADTVGNNFSPAPGIPSVNMVATAYGMATSGGNCHQRGGRLECIGLHPPCLARRSRSVM